MNSLCLDNLSIGYPRRTIARDINLTLAAGQSLAILGPNGSGKTTLLRTMLGLIPGRAGDASVDGRSIATIPPAALAQQIAYVSQLSASLFSFSVIEVVEMARAPHLGWFDRPGPRDREIASNALARLSISAFMHREFSELSGGEQQLVMIARALASEAKCLLLDEPTASLDFGNRELILQTLCTLKAEGVAVIFTTHEPEHALRVCADPADQVLTIARDGTVHVGSAATVVNPPALAALYGIDQRVFERFQIASIAK